MEMDLISYIRQVKKLKYTSNPSCRYWLDIAPKRVTTVSIFMSRSIGEGLLKNWTLAYGLAKGFPKLL